MFTYEITFVVLSDVPDVVLIRPRSTVETSPVIPAK